MDGPKMRFFDKKKRFYSLMRILVVIILCQALLFSVLQLIVPNVRPGGYEGEPNLYHTYSEMVSEIQDISSNHSSIVRLHNLTTTFEGRTVWALKISDVPQENDSSEPDVLFIGGQQANSFISVEMALYLTHHLTTNYAQDDDIKELINEREIWIIPMLNPDGHVYVEGGFVDSEEWVKNRRNIGENTYGVNLDRNYGFNFSVDDHTSNNTDSPYYHGESPFSEPEPQAVRDLVESQSHDFVLSLSLSSYGETITYPWGHTNSTSPDNELLREIASDMAMYTDYEVNQSGDINVTHGNLNDWLYNASVLPFTIMMGTENIPEEGFIDQISQDNLPSCLYLIDISDNPNRALKAEWTFIVYMSGDNNLEGDGIRDINEMEMVGSNPYVNIVVQFDRKIGEDDSNGNWKDTRRFLIMKDDDENNITSPMIENLNEKNMGHPQTFLDFVNWTIDNYPAERYFLDIWGHGRGWRGVSVDNSDWLEMGEIKSILPHFKERIDVVGFDNCNMAMIEVYTTFLGYVDYIVGSEKEEDAWGWPYDVIFSELMENPQISPVNFSTFIVEFYVEWAVNNSIYSATASVVDMSYLHEVINRTDEFARELNWTFALYSDEIDWAISMTEGYAKPPNPNDLYHFLERIEEKVPNTPIKIKAQNVRKSIENLVVAERHLSKSSDPFVKVVDNAHGISVWLYQGGTPSIFSEYQTLDFAKLTHWDEFLYKTKNLPPEPFVSFQFNYSLSDSDSEGNMDTISLEYSTNTTGLNIALGVYDSENEHITTYFLNGTSPDVPYQNSFNPEDYGFPSDFYNFYAYIVDNQNLPQNYSEVINIWLGNEKPDAVLVNISFYRSDGVLLDGDTGRKPIDGDETKIEVYVANNGTTDLFGLKIEFFEGQNIIYTDSIDLIIGKNMSVSAMWLAKSGERNIRIVVDPENLVKEFYENNNEIVKVVDVKPIIPTNSLVIRGKIYNRDNVNIIGAKVQIKNLRTNATINKTTNEEGYSEELDPSWYMEGDSIDVKASYSSAKDNVTVIVYSDDIEVWVNVTLDTELYDALFFFKLGLIGFEIIGFILVIKYYIGMKRKKGE
jgi:carboxypeptidase T